MSQSTDRTATDIQFAARSTELPGRAEVARWVRTARQGVAGALCVRFVDEPEGRDLNRRFRGVDRATNVLSFPVDAMPPGLPPLLGDVVVCAPIVEAEARAQGKAPAAHYAHMIVHGVLHLRGYDHQQCDAAKVMEALERELLGSLGFADPYAGKDRE